jgi:hypothetical protein
MTTTPLPAEQLAASITLKNQLAAAFEHMDAHQWGYDHGFCGSYGVDPETDSFVDTALAVVQPELDRTAAELDRVRAELATARAQMATVAAQRDRLRARMTNLADRWDHALGVDKSYARTLRAEISIEPFEMDDCGCKTSVHPGHYPSCPTRAAARPGA